MIVWNDEELATKISELKEICIKDKFWNGSDNHKRYMKLKNEQDRRERVARDKANIQRVDAQIKS